MARDLANKTDVDSPDSDYPFGRIRDEFGNNDGTPFDEQLYGDFHQFFSKMFDESGLTYNNLPDNAYSGFQFYEALQENIAKFKSIEVYFTNTSLTDIALGGVSVFFSFFGVGAFTLPSATVNNIGKKIKILNISTFDLTLLPFGSDTIAPIPTPNPLILKQGDSVDLYIAITGQWAITAIYRKANAEVVTKIIPIGDWNMNTTGTLTVAHGVTMSKIRSISAVIYPDNSLEVYPLTGLLNLTPGGSIYAGAINCNLFRFSDAQAAYTGSLSAFGNSSFSATSFNRGWITIEYAV
jgi:hypothetical protein